MEVMLLVEKCGRWMRASLTLYKGCKPCCFFEPREIKVNKKRSGCVRQSSTKYLVSPLSCVCVVRGNRDEGQPVFLAEGSGANRLVFNWGRHRVQDLIAT